MLSNDYSIETIDKEVLIEFCNDIIGAAGGCYNEFGFYFFKDDDGDLCYDGTIHEGNEGSVFLPRHMRVSDGALLIESSIHLHPDASDERSISPPSLEDFYSIDNYVWHYVIDTCRRDHTLLWLHAYKDGDIETMLNEELREDPYILYNEPADYLKLFRSRATKHNVNVELRCFQLRMKKRYVVGIGKEY